MPDGPTIKTNGNGSRREAAALGRQIGDSVAAHFGSVDRAVHIDTLQVQVRAGASKAELDRAVRAAIDRALRRGAP